jgi:hypothetical protein
MNSEITELQHCGLITANLDAMIDGTARFWA